MSDKLEHLLARTTELHAAAVTHVESLHPVSDARAVLAFRAGGLALEHALALRTLLASDYPTSAFALLRPQFECLVRGVWLLHAAGDRWVEKFAQPLTMESARQANEGPGLADMLKELEASAQAPGHIVAQLREFKELTWKPLNSFTHGGIHPLTRLTSGYPPSLTYDALRNANAVLALTMQLLSILTGDPRNMAPVRRMHEAFEDCFHLLPSQPVA